MAYEYVKDWEIRPYRSSYVNNARTHSPEQITKLRSSLREFGFINPVIIDRDFNVIAGHGRIAAAKKKGLRKFRACSQTS